MSATLNTSRIAGFDGLTLWPRGPVEAIGYESVLPNQAAVPANYRWAPQFLAPVRA